MLRGRVAIVAFRQAGKPAGSECGSKAPHSPSEAILTDSAGKLNPAREDSSLAVNLAMLVLNPVVNPQHPRYRR